MADRVVLIGRESSATAILYNALAREFDMRVLYEAAPSTTQLLRWRAKHVGWWAVFGQVLFQILVAKPRALFSKARRAEILRRHDAAETPVPADRVSLIASVNSAACWELVRSLSPRAVVINGTRILSKRSIAAIGAPILNTHVGITPMYRGVHGAYWALVQGDRQHCGVTVHLVDEGIDTGGILHQAVIEPTAKDDFTTYPVMQMALGSKLMVRAVREIIAGTAKPFTVEGESRRWYHPTLWAYLRNRIGRGVR